MTMSYLDWGITGIVLLSSVLGFFRGITKELLSLISWLGSGILTYFSFSFLKHIARENISSPMLADGTTILASFLLFLIGFSFLNHLITAMIQKSRLNSIDRSLGFGFGVVRGCFILFALEIVLSCLYHRANYPTVFQTSHFKDFILQGGETLVGMLPKTAQQWINEQRQKLTTLSAAQTSVDTVSRTVTNLSQSVLTQPNTVPHHQEPSDKQFEPEKKMETLASLQTKPQSDKAPKKKTNQAELERLLNQVD